MVGISAIVNKKNCPANFTTILTDGVNFDVTVFLPDGSTRPLLSRLLDPAGRPADRGPQLITLDFTLAQAGEVELFIGPGPSGLNTRDWALLGPVKFD